MAESSKSAAMPTTATTDRPTFRVPPEAQHLTSRRVSFRSTVSDPTLPEAYLAALESKRRQLDESIHKYIASKEREYKSFEKEVRSQHKASAAVPAPEDAKRRSSSESTILSSTDAAAHGVIHNERKLTAIAALAAHGLRQRSDSNAVDEEEIWNETKAAIAGITDRRASMERDKDFAGLFTPEYLAAIDDKVGRSIERATSDPSSLLATQAQRRPESHPQDLQRAQSDSLVHNTAQAKPKRPSQLQVASRTSSSGSSADGRLASALKSPTQKELPPKRKRVSLAVGDSIVAPSDSVPASQLITQTTAPSHSRLRSPVRDSPEQITAPVMSGTTAATDFQQMQIPNVEKAEHVKGGHVQKEPAVVSTTPIEQPRFRAPDSPRPTPRSTSSPSKAPASKIDPDGDLFDLDEDSENGLAPNGEDEDDEEEDNNEGITGRVDPRDVEKLSRRRSRNEDVEYDPEAGLVPDPVDQSSDPDSVEADGTVHLEYRAESATASQQPINPGFRRPSVSNDPIFRGSLKEYASAEMEAVDNEVYGSRFEPQASKGSFKAGSLGESFMEKNAAEMMRLRASRKEAAVRS